MCYNRGANTRRRCGNAPAAEEKKQAASQPAPEAQKKPAEQPVSTETHGTAALITALVFVAATIGLKIVLKNDLLESHDGLLLAARIAYPILHVLLAAFLLLAGCVVLWASDKTVSKKTGFRVLGLFMLPFVNGAGWLLWKVIAERPESIVLSVLLWVGFAVLVLASLLALLIFYPYD